MCGKQLSAADSKRVIFIHVYKQIAMVKHVHFLFFTCVSDINWKVLEFKKNTFQGESKRFKNED